MDAPGRGGAAREARGGGGGRYEEAGPARKCRPRYSSLLFLLFHVKLFFEGVRIDYKVVDIFGLVLYAFE